jgi:hypothetical protein
VLIIGEREGKIMDVTVANGKQLTCSFLICCPKTCICLCLSCPDQYSNPKERLKNVNRYYI